MLTRFDPFRDFDRFAEQAWGASERNPVRSFPMDVVRREHELVLSFDMPGVDPETIDLTVERDTLTVSAERRPATSEGDDVLVRERPVGSYRRQLVLGKTFDADSVEASYDDGVLTITVPVAEAAKPRKVAVSSAQREAIETTAS